MRNLSKVLLAAGVLAVSIPFTAMAAEKSPMKPGKWQITMQTEMPGVPFKIPAVTISQCIKPEDLESPDKSLPKASKDDKCKVSDYKIEGNKVTWAVKCADKDATSGTGEITYSDDAYDGVMKMTTGGQDVTTKMKGKRLGDCE